MQLRGARDPYDPRLFFQEPGQCYLCRCRLLLGCDLAEHLNQGLVRLASLRRKTGKAIAEVIAAERRVLADGAREETPTERAEGNQADPEFLERRQDLLLRFSPPQRVFALEGRHRLDCVGAAACL